MRFETMALQIPPSKHRCHYIKVKVRVHRYATGAIAIFHGPRGLAYFAPDGTPILDEQQQAA